jgi:hypothetical protein
MCPLPYSCPDIGIINRREQSVARVTRFTVLDCFARVRGDVIQALLLEPAATEVALIVKFILTDGDIAAGSRRAITRNVAVHPL